MSPLQPANWSPCHPTYHLRGYPFQPVSQNVFTCLIAKVKTPIEQKCLIFFSFQHPRKNRCFILSRQKNKGRWRQILPKLKTNRNGNILSTLWHLCCDSYFVELYVGLYGHKYPIKLHYMEYYVIIAWVLSLKHILEGNFPTITTHFIFKTMKKNYGVWEMMANKGLAIQA